MTTQKFGAMRLPHPYVMPGLRNYSIKASKIIETFRGIYPITPEPIQGTSLIVELVFGKEYHELVLRNRKRELVFPRQVGMFLLYLADISFVTAGAHYSRDHSTAVHGKGKCLNVLETKYPKNDYNNLTLTLRIFSILYPKSSLSALPRGWDNTSQRICEPQHRLREPAKNVSPL